MSSKSVRTPLREKRAYNVSSRVTEAEKRAIESLAKTAGMSEGRYLLEGRRRQIEEVINH